MAITAAQVKQLRDVTGAGMMDCKKALTECNGDMDAAVEFLRKKGQAKAEKKANRIAAEGICYIAQDGDTKAAVVEVNSETDFVAQNEKFRTYVAKVAQQALNTAAEDIDAFMGEAWAEDTAKTVKDSLVDMIAVISEKLSIRRFKKIEETEGISARLISRMITKSTRKRSFSLRRSRRTTSFPRIRENLRTSSRRCSSAD